MKILKSNIDIKFKIQMAKFAEFEPTDFLVLSECLLKMFHRISLRAQSDLGNAFILTTILTKIHLGEFYCPFFLLHGFHSLIGKKWHTLS